MARMTKELGIGVVASSFNPLEVSTILNQLTPIEIDRMKHNSLEANMVLNADIEMKKMLSLYEQLFSGK